ncbi:hypothetical protein NT6N_24560 [Oceaniferula spumae]|uniref:Uncharacterized protein n=1 Tax=Oceaniferula spumae TaxID=2979115 RepID=A0AAT9FN48_9BACT
MKCIQIGLLVAVIGMTVWPHLYWRHKAKSYDAKQWLFSSLGFWAGTGGLCLFISSILLLVLLIIGSGIFPLFHSAWIAPVWLSVLGLVVWCYILWWAIWCRRGISKNVAEQGGADDR